MLDNTFWLSMVYVSLYFADGNVDDYKLFFDNSKRAGRGGTLMAAVEEKHFKIILPLSYPIILSVSLIMFLNTWSQFQIPLILVSSMDTKPMAIVVSEFVTKDSVEYGLIATAGIVSLIPPAVTAIIFRKYLISGMVGGSVKG